MFCKTCGAQNNEGQKFCQSCGSPIEQPSMNNGNPNPNMNMGMNPNMNMGMNPNMNMGMNPNMGMAPNMGMGMGMAPAFGIPERNIVTCILLSLITGGIYGLYWMYCITEDSNRLSGNPNATSGGMVILYSFLTCGIYTLYWMYKRGEIVDNYNMQRGLPSSSNAVLYLVLSIFGLGIVSYCLLQTELNKAARGF